MVPGKGVRYREVSAIKHVRYREVPLYYTNEEYFSKHLTKGRHKVILESMVYLCDIHVLCVNSGFHANISMRTGQKVHVKVSIYITVDKF